MPGSQSSATIFTRAYTVDQTRKFISEANIYEQDSTGGSMALHPGKMMHIRLDPLIEP